jgi:hypothetical protein
LAAAPWGGAAFPPEDTEAEPAEPAEPALLQPLRSRQPESRMTPLNAAPRASVTLVMLLGRAVGANGSARRR